MDVAAVLTAQELQALGLTPDQADTLAAATITALEAGDPARAWADLIRNSLKPDQPFEVHRLLYDRVFADWSGPGPRPAWPPDETTLAGANLTTFMARHGFHTVPDLFEWSVTDRDGFWAAVAEHLGIVFAETPEATLDVSAGVEHVRWFPGARMNIVETCFRADPDAPAVISAERGALHTTTYGTLAEQADGVARALHAAGFSEGDRIAIAMPMDVRAVAAFLGIVTIGAEVVGIADSFAAHEIGVRLDLTDTACIVTSDVVVRLDRTYPMYDKVVAADAPRAVVAPAGTDLAVDLRDGDLPWQAFLDGGAAEDPVRPMPRQPGDPAVILFSSGTTGTPKVIPWTHATPVKAVMDGNLHHDVRRGDVVAWPTSLGWMMGPWLIFNSLINGATMALFDDAPTGPEFCRFVEKAGVTMLGVVPSLVARWRATDATAGSDWTGIRQFGSTGESSNEDDMLWLMSRAGYRPVMEYCGGTEIGGGYISGTMLQPQSPSCFSTPMFGTRLHVLDDEGRPAERGEMFLEPPAIGLSVELLGADHHAVYFEGVPPGPHGQLLRRHGDEMEHLGGGYFRALGRVDDTMNLAGIKVGSAELERCIADVDGISEAAAVAVQPEGGGPERLVVFAVPAAGSESDPDDLRAAMQRRIRDQLNPLFAIDRVVITDALPRTASNKLMRRSLRYRLKETN
jgi:acetyl-CoA synthetase